MLGFGLFFIEVRDDTQDEIQDLGEYLTFWVCIVMFALELHPQLLTQELILVVQLA